jgi:hypothetical protein
VSAVEGEMAEQNTNVAAASRPDPYADDPFFRRGADTTWNACIGKQGNEENYLDGYIEAAIELADAVVDKKLFAKRDTLILPILYNVRHAVELVLKFIDDHLVAAGLLPRSGRRNHNIKAHWHRLSAASLGDEKLSQTLQALKPFIDSLSRIDDDGQELRYHLNRSDGPSLSNYSLANLQVIRESLSKLSEIISVLKYRTLSFLDERDTGSFTSRCSRRDLVAIAHMMPRREMWKEPLFDQQKAFARTRYNLSNRQFSKALEVIQCNREMKAIIGVESNLLHVSDDEIVWLIEEWKRLHPLMNADNDLGTEYLGVERIEKMMEELSTRTEIIDEIEWRLSADKLAEIEAIFYLGRDGLYPECYEQQVALAQSEHAAANDQDAKIDHLLDKTNFLTCVRLAATKLGRLSLAQRLAT